MGNWKLASPDRSVTLDVQADDNGGVNGSLTVASVTYPVLGIWGANFAGGTGQLRPYSAFAVSGMLPQDLTVLIAATGIMTGPGNSPTRIDIQVDTSSTADGTSQHYPQMALSPF